MFTLIGTVSLGTVSVFAQITPGSTDNFITQWNTESGTSLVIATFTGGGIGPYSFDVYWEEVANPSNNGVFSSQSSAVFINGLISNTDYRIEISGLYPRIVIANQLKENIKEVVQWGTIPYESMYQAFDGCTNVEVTATDIPNLSNVTNCSRMFRNCTNLTANSTIENWDMTNVVSISEMFRGCSQFIQEIGSWNTNNITNMGYVFLGATSFNQNIGNWNTGNVTTMEAMFYDATSFNQNIGNWNVENVTNMQSMFNDATSFNQDVSGWNTENVTNMSSMFNSATSFNQNIGNWNTGNVTSMSSMFENANSFNQNIGNWDVSNVASMARMFLNNQSFDQDIGNWNVSNVINMDRMFNNASEFNQDIGSWNLSSISQIATCGNGGICQMLMNSGLDCYNYSVTLVGWEANPATPNNLSLHVVGKGYLPSAQTAHNNLTTIKNWYIGGDSLTSVITPTFSFSNSLSICSNTTPLSLPTTSSNGLSGNWTPEVIDNTIPNTYIFTPEIGSCSEIFTLNVLINSVDNTVSQTNETITANLSGAQYQWLDCDNGNNPISGENNQSFTATNNGNYAVEITDNGCTETSNCIAINSVSITNPYQNNDFVVYPNPSTGLIFFNKVNENIQVFNLLGALQGEYRNVIQINLSNLENGFYLIQDNFGHVSKVQIVK